MLIIEAYSEYNFDNKDWYIPFEIHVDFNEMVGRYYYIVRDSDISYNSEFVDLENYPIFISHINVKSNFVTKKFTIHFEYNKDQLYDITGVTFKVEINASNFHWVDDTLTPIPYDDETGYFEIEFDHDFIPIGDLHFIIETHKPGVLLNKYKTTTFFKYDLSSMSQSQLLEEEVNGNIIRRLLDIPGIEKEWFDGLTEEEKKFFEQEVIQKMINLYDSTTMRMLNTFINMKFPKTVGITHNIYYNKEVVTVKDIVTSRTDITTLNVGDRYAINRPVVSGDMFEGKEGYVALCLSTSPETWKYEFYPISTLLLNEADNLKYFYDGRRWFRPIDLDPPEYTIPLEIEAILYTESGSIGYIEKAKDVLLEYFSPKFGIDSSIYRSEIISVLQQIEGVNYVRLIKPEIDIYFEYEMKDLTHEQLTLYVPEYISFKRDNIKIEVKLGNEVSGGVI